MEKIASITVRLQEGGSKEVLIGAEELEKLLGEKVEFIEKAEEIEDRAILVTRTCGCGTRLEVAINISDKEPGMLCHPCGNFSKVSPIQPHERYD